VHALGGLEMTRAAVKARGGARSKLLAITVLTSHDEASLGRLGLAGPLPETVRRLARLAQEAGMDGVVASPQEVGLIREACGPDFLVVTPGIRPEGTRLGDQARPATPAGAVRAGSTYLVVGRPITEAADPGAAADAIVSEMESAL
jgi:orotidine-5'-phosphate decarboxylase